MASAVGLRADFTVTDLRRLAQSRREGGQVRRLLALAVIYDGGRRSEAARTGGVGLQTVRDWVLRFNADGPDGLVDGKAPGGRPRLDANQRLALAAAVESGPIPAAHGVVRWRLVDLVQWIRDEFALSISTQTLSRELRAMGWLRHVFADGGYAGDKLRDALAPIGKWTLAIIKRSDTAKGFELLPRRWVVERTFAWLGRCRRLAKDWETSIASSTAWAQIASIRMIVRRTAKYCYA